MVPGLWWMNLHPPKIWTAHDAAKHSLSLTPWIPAAQSSSWWSIFGEGFKSWAKVICGKKTGISLHFFRKQLQQLRSLNDPTLTVWAHTSELCCIHSLYTVAGIISHVYQQVSCMALLTLALATRAKRSKRLSSAKRTSDCSMAATIRAPFDGSVETCWNGWLINRNQHNLSHSQRDCFGVTTRLIIFPLTKSFLKTAKIPS